MRKKRFTFFVLQACHPLEFQKSQNSYVTMHLSDPQKHVLLSLVRGATLKAHRYFDGTKTYKLYPLDGEVESVSGTIMDALKNRGLIDSNKKFPAATYLLTEKGRKVAEGFDNGPVRPLSAKNYG